MASTTIKRVVVYGRVSTTNHGQDVTMQVQELREFASRRSWVIVEEYIDDGFSGAKDSRPALNKLMADAHQRRFDAVLVWKLGRFGRSLRHLVNALADLEARGIAFISLRDNLDLSTPSGRLMFQIIGAMGEFERQLIAERVRAGMRHARTKGRRIGRPSRVPLTDRLRAQIAEAHQEGGGSLRAIATRFGTSLGTVQRCIGSYQRDGSQTAAND